MTDHVAEFMSLLQTRLIPEYRDGTFAPEESAIFQPSPQSINELDARNFLLAWHAGFVRYVGRGSYKTARSGSVERFFNAGSKNATPRTFRLAHEAFINVACLARLHFEFGWPAELLGTQSINYAFDLVAYLPAHNTEYIACEVKKTASEVDRLITQMRVFCAPQYQAMDEVGMTGVEINSFRKVRGLRQRQASIFWAVGPGGMSEVFAMSYGDDGNIDLASIDETALQFPISA